MGQAIKEMSPWHGLSWGISYLHEIAIRCLFIEKAKNIFQKYLKRNVFSAMRFLGQKGQFF
jgi:hypothetical protein